MFTSFRDSSKINENHLSTEEHSTLKDLIKNRDIVIQKADKGNPVVIVSAARRRRDIKIPLYLSAPMPKNLI